MINTVKPIHKEGDPMLSGMRASYDLGRAGESVKKSETFRLCLWSKLVKPADLHELALAAYYVANNRLDLNTLLF